MRRLWVVLAAGVGLVALRCGSSSSTCVPGQSVACAGGGGCSGAQTCRADGTYAPCDCGGGGDGGGLDGALPDGAVGPDGGAGDDGGTFSVKALPGLVLWLDTSAGVVQDPVKPGTVKRWLDQSGNGNDAVVQCVNACSVSIDPQALNGHDVLVNDNWGYFTIADSPTTRWGTSDWAILMVIKPSGGTNAAIWDRVIRITETDNDFRLSVLPDSLTVTWPTLTKFNILAARGTQLELRAGGSTATGPKSTTDVSGGPGVDTGLLHVGYFNVAEVIAIKGTLTDADLAKTTAYLKNKYKLP